VASGGGVALPEVRLDAMLRVFVPKTSLRSEATSLEALLDDLEARFPRLQRRIRDETRRVRPFVKVFVNGAEVKRDAGGAVPLAPNDHVDILHSIQGG
jgi:sulfur-carrier protein